MSLISSGHIACQGCAAMSTVRLIVDTLGPRTVAVIPACCLSVCNGAYPSASLKIPVINCAFETSAITAAGIRAGLDKRGDEDVNVVVLAGDGGTFDIGLQALSGAAERNDNIIYVCYDNEAYMNTGNQRSSATPYSANTMTTPGPTGFKKENKKNILGIMMAHGIPYMASATIAYPKDLKRKVEKAKNIEGFRFIWTFTPCPTGWKFNPKDSMKAAKLAVKCGAFPLAEYENGELKFTREPTNPEKYAEEYLKLQGRFKNVGY